MYHHVTVARQKRYLAEIDFLYSPPVCGVNDSERAAKALAGIVGKRLTFRRTNQTANS